MSAVLYKEVACYDQLISYRKIKLAVVCDSIAVLVYEVISAAKIVAFFIYVYYIDDCSINLFIQSNLVCLICIYEEVACLDQLISFRKCKLVVVCNSISVIVYKVVSTAKVLAAFALEYYVDDSSTFSVKNDVIVLAFFYEEITCYIQCLVSETQIP